MKPRTRILLVAVVLLVALTISGGWVLSTLGRIDPQEVGTSLLRRAGAGTGLVLDAEEFSFAPLRGIELGGFRAKGRLDAGRLDLTAESLVLKPRLLPLLGGRIEVREAVLERPEILLKRRDRGRPKATERPREAGPRDPSKKKRGKKGRPQAAVGVTDEPRAPGAPYDVRIRDLRLVAADLTLTSRRGGRRTAHLENLYLDLDGLEIAGESRRPVLDARAGGSFTADEIVVDDLTATDVRGRIEIEEGIVRLLDLELIHQLGPVRAEEVTVDLTGEPFEYTLDLAGSRLDTGQLLGAEPGGGMGISSLEFAGRGFGPGSENLTGKGSLDIAAGTLPAVPALVNLDRLLGSADLVGARHEPSRVTFEVDGNRVEIDPTRFEAEDVRLDLEGWVDKATGDRAGRLSLDLVLSAPRGRIEITEISETVLDKLTDDEGRTSLAFRIRGTRQAPRVSPDLPELTRSERDRLEREIKDAIKDKLRELLGKDDDG